MRLPRPQGLIDCLQAQAAGTKRCARYQIDPTLTPMAQLRGGVGTN